MKFLSRLNGWQRLFVLFAVVIYAPFVFFATPNVLPDNPTVDEVYEALPNDIKKMVDSGDLELQHTITLGDHKAVPGSAARQYIATPNPSILEYVIVFNKMPSHPADFYDTEGKVRDSIYKVYDREKLLMGLFLFGIALVPLVALYIVGLMVVWVIKGFRKQSNS